MSYFRLIRCLVFSQCIVVFTLLASPTQAHHSALAYFDMDSTAQIEGTVTKVHWRNPHVRIAIAVADESGQLTEWDIELSALSSFRNRGYTSAFAQVGEKVKVYGHPANRGRAAMVGLNMLLENGAEVILEVSEGPYYGLQSGALELAVDTRDPEVERLARKTADGIFRVWSTAVDDPDFPMFRGGYPLGEAAVKSQSEWVADERALESCWLKSMPYLMITPQPIEFVRSGDNVLLRFEEDDVERVIYMDGGDADPDSSIYGYSVGHWEEGALVVETNHINSPNFDDRGTPQSENIHLVERFMFDNNSDNLNYKITITDAETFTEPFDLQRVFVWRPERTIIQFDCDAGI